VASASNRGFGGGMNVGVERALARGCTELLLVNPDLSIDPDVVAALADQVRRTPRTLVTPAIVRPDGRAWFTGGRLDLRSGWTRNVVDDGLPRGDGWLTGACLALSADLWRELGGFDEDFFLYWEDVDLSHRCTAAGAQLLVRRDLSAVHDVGGTQGVSGPAKSRVYYRYNTRNRLLFAAKHLRPRDALRWVRSSPRYAWAVLLRGGRRQLLRPWGPVSAVVLGTAAGTWHVVRAAASRA
jgi:GT2 family glycosyltransferase